jgi:hypothetical protein
MLNTNENVIKNKLQSYLDETGFKNLTPNDQQLREMAMSKKRFTHLRINKGPEMSFSEAVNLCEYLFKPFFPELKPWELYDISINGKPQSNE